MTKVKFQGNFTGKEKFPVRACQFCSEPLVDGAIYVFHQGIGCPYVRALKLNDEGRLRKIYFENSQLDQYVN